MLLILYIATELIVLMINVILLFNNADHNRRKTIKIVADKYEIILILNNVECENILAFIRMYFEDNRN